MSIIIGDIEFEGPYTDCEQIRPEPGIYGILCEVDDEFELIDLDDSHCVKDCLESSEYSSNMLFYAENCPGTLMAVVHYTPALTIAERTSLKTSLLADLNAQFLEPAY